MDLLTLTNSWEDCLWDGGDCDLYNSLLDCEVNDASIIGNGKCNDFLVKNKVFSPILNQFWS